MTDATAVIRQPVAETGHGVGVAQRNMSEGNGSAYATRRCTLPEGAGRGDAQIGISEVGTRNGPSRNGVRQNATAKPGRSRLRDGVGACGEPVSA